MERIAADIHGPPPETETWTPYIVVISVYCTEWVQPMQIRGQTK